MVAAVVTGEPFAQYAQSPEVHATALRYLLTSPLAYKAHQERPDVETDAMRLGRACHTAVLEPSKFFREFAVWKGGRRAGTEWKEFCSGKSSKTVLTQDQYDTAVAIQRAVRSHKVASRYLCEPQGRAEVSIHWVHERTGVAIKCRLDWLGSVVLDLKTCRDPSPAKFSTVCAQYGYALQLALYRDAACAAGLGALPGKIIAVQSTEPHDVVVYDLDGELQALGTAQYERALDLLVECTKSGNWPGQYPEEEVQLRLPAWATNEDEDEQLTFGGEVMF